MSKSLLFAAAEIVFAARPLPTFDDPPPGDPPPGDPPPGDPPPGDPPPGDPPPGDPPPGDPPPGDPPQRPDWLPEKFFDAEGGPKYEELAKAYGESESALGRLRREKGDGVVPEKPEDYLDEASLKLVHGDAYAAERLEDYQKDETFRLMSSAMHRAGISKDKATVFLQEVAKQVRDAVPSDEDAQKQIDTAFSKELGEKHKQIVELSENRIEALAKDGSFTAEEAEFLRVLNADPQGASLLHRKLLPMWARVPAPDELLDTGQRGGFVSESDFERAMADPKWGTDPEFRRQARDKEERRQKALGIYEGDGGSTNFRD